MKYNLFQKSFGKLVKIKQTSFLLLSKCLAAQHCTVHLMITGDIDKPPYYMGGGAVAHLIFEPR